MKEYFPYLFFLLRFIFVYLGLTLLYQSYLDYYACTVCMQSDTITQIVSDKSAVVLRFFGFDFFSIQDPHNPSMFLAEGNNIVSMVNEGCNALSVMIIFLSFVVGLYAKAIQTSLFILSGIGILFVSNIFRVSLLNYIILLHPKYSNLAHDIIFPSIIYGTVFLLWIIWVFKFALPYWEKKLVKDVQ